MGIFIACSGVGLLLLALGIFFDGIFDVIDDSFVPAIGVAVASFGATGLIYNGFLAVDSFGFTLTIFLVSLIVSTLTTIMFIIFWKWMRKNNSASEIVEVSIDSIIGTEGRVIRWGNNNGEALFRYLGARKKINILTEDNNSLEVNDKVVALRRDTSNEENDVFYVAKVEEVKEVSVIEEISKVEEIEEIPEIIKVSEIEEID